MLVCCSIFAISSLATQSSFPPTFFSESFYTAWTQRGHRLGRPTVGCRTNKQQHPKKRKMFRVALFGLVCFFAVPASGEPLVPADFDVPEVLETDRLRPRMLTVNDVVKDYDAVVSSTDHLSVSKHSLTARPYFQYRTKHRACVVTCSTSSVLTRMPRDTCFQYGSTVFTAVRSMQAPGFCVLNIFRPQQYRE
jgi:hypothetical protein